MPTAALYLDAAHSVRGQILLGVDWIEAPCTCCVLCFPQETRQLSGHITAKPSIVTPVCVSAVHLLRVRFHPWRSVEAADWSLLEELIWVEANAEADFDVLRGRNVGSDKWQTVKPQRPMWWSSSSVLQWQHQGNKGQIIETEIACVISIPFYKKTLS